jgi:hypothetical protein
LDDKVVAVAVAESGSGDVVGSWPGVVQA